MREGGVLRARLRQPVARQPLWLMRQAGRYMKVYRDLRAKHTILEMIKAPELAAAIAFLLLIVMLLVRPQGLMGRMARRRA